MIKLAQLLLFASFLSPIWGFAQQVVSCAGSNDTAEIQAALDAASEGKEVKLEGVCYVSQLQLNSLQILSGGTLQQIAGTHQHMIVLKDPHVHRVILKDMTIKGAWQPGQAATYDDGIYFDVETIGAAHYLQIENVTVTHFGGNGITLAKSKGTAGGGEDTIINAQVEYNALHGIVIYTDDTYVHDSRVDMNGLDGILISGWSTMVTTSKIWMNGRSGQAKRHGIELANGTQGDLIEGVNVQGNAGWGIYYNPGTKCTTGAIMAGGNVMGASYAQ